MSDIPDLERILYFPGELLTAGDLTTEDGNNRELRWLHNRTLHRWGIGVGFDVKGSRGDTSVTVSAGYAIDSLGREIILSGPLQLPIPAVPGGANGSPATYYLVANYVDDAGQTALAQREATACGVGGAVRLSNAPAIRWKTLGQLNLGIDVVLGEVTIQNCVLARDVSGAARRYAYAEFTPFFKAGQIEAKSIAWIAWKEGSTNIGFKAAIDTSAANFRSTPAYSAQIVGNRSLPGASLVVAEFVSIADESPTGFTLHVAMPTVSATVNPARVTDPVTGPQLMTQLGWRVSWMGLEG